MTPISGVAQASDGKRHVRRSTEPDQLPRAELHCGRQAASARGFHEQPARTVGVTGTGTLLRFGEEARRGGFVAGVSGAGWVSHGRPLVAGDPHRTCKFAAV